MIRITGAGLALFAFASAQSIAHNSSDFASSTPAPQTLAELPEAAQNVEGIQNNNDSAPNDISTTTTVLVTVNAVVNIPDTSTGTSFTYVTPTTATSWPTFSFDSATTQETAFTYVPTTTNDISLEPATVQDALFTSPPVSTDESTSTYMPTTSSEEHSSVFAPSATNVVYSPAPTTTELVPLDFAPTSNTDQTVVTTAQPVVGPESSAITADSSYSLETVQTMVEAPTLDVPKGTSTTSRSARPTPVVNAPHVEHQASTLQPPAPAQPTPAHPNATLPVGPDPVSAQQQSSAHIGSQDAPASAPPAYHEPTQGLSTTRHSSSGSMQSAAQAPASHAAHPASSATQPRISSSVLTTTSLTRETSKPVLQTAQDSPPAPTIHALTYQGQTVQLSGLTLAAGPTGSSSDGGDSSTSSGGAADSAAVVASKKSRMLLLMALGMASVAW